MVEGQFYTTNQDITSFMSLLHTSFTTLKNFHRSNTQILKNLKGFGKEVDWDQKEIFMVEWFDRPGTINLTKACLKLVSHSSFTKPLSNFVAMNDLLPFCYTNVK
jgi:hypothetical protein